MESPMPLSPDRPFLFARIHDIRVAIPAHEVQEILQMPAWHVIPNAPDFMRGMIHLRGSAIPLMDLRLRLRMPSSLVEIEAMKELLHQREQDHIRWLHELEASIHEKRPFTLARDPTQCAFGKWYYSYKTDDLGFTALLYQFDAPHRRIHGIADVALKHAADGDFAGAEAVIEKTRSGDLHTMVQLFGEARESFARSRKELAILLTSGDRQMAISADKVESIDHVDPTSVRAVGDLCQGTGATLLRNIARKDTDPNPVFLLDPEDLFQATA